MAFTFDMPGRSTRRLADVTGEIDPVDRAIAQAGWVNHDGPLWELRVAKSERWFRWSWFLIDRHFPDRAVREGYAWSKNGAHRKAYRAHVAELTERQIRRAGLDVRYNSELNATDR